MEGLCQGVFNLKDESEMIASTKIDEKTFLDGNEALKEATKELEKKVS
jgi:hypothetical protein